MTGSFVAMGLLAPLSDEIQPMLAREAGRAPRSCGSSPRMTRRHAEAVTFGYPRVRSF
jgi:hypothetical protein